MEGVLGGCAWRMFSKLAALGSDVLYTIYYLAVQQIAERC